MKKIFLFLTTLLLLVIPSLGLAKTEPVIKSDSRTFNPLTGVYNLDGNVYVDLNNRIIVGDHAQVYMYSMKVDAQGNVKYTDDKIAFTCDKVSVVGKEETAYVTGNCTFTSGSTTITSNSGNYNWDNKLASFSGSVVVNGSPAPGEVVYNVETEKLQ
jgi:lipopolysaccharide export system protein LptA